MILSIDVQLRIVAFSILAGLITGILFDLYRIIRGFNTLKIIMVVEDILFWILTAIIIFIFLLYTNYAFIGTYVYLLMGLGILIHLKFFSKHFREACIGLLSFLYKVVRISLKKIVYPLKVIFYSGDYKKGNNSEK